MFTFLALGDASSPSESSKYKKFLCFCPIFMDHFDLLGIRIWIYRPHLILIYSGSGFETFHITNFKLPRFNFL